LPVLSYWIDGSTVSPFSEIVSTPRAVSAPASAQVSSNVRRSLALALPPSLRGTAHWEGAAFVNDYEDTVAGKKTAVARFFHLYADLAHSCCSDGHGQWNHEDPDHDHRDSGGSLRPRVEPRDMAMSP
jgi:hypothetical protein